MPTHKRQLNDPDTRETIKELAQLDGAFIIPELWFLRRHGIHITGPYSTRRSDQITVASKD